MIRVLSSSLTTGSMNPTVKTRRTQEERSSATRDAVIRATIQCLIEEGYAATTTTAIQLRAGVSRGALTHHFPTKTALIASAIRYLMEARTAAMVAQARSIPEDADRVEAGLHLIWSETFENGDLFAATMELWTAARTDDELHATLLEVERELAKRLLGQCAKMFGEEITAKPTFERAFISSLLHLRGAALTNIVRAKGSDATRYLTDAIHVFRCLLDYEESHP